MDRLSSSQKRRLEHQDGYWVSAAKGSQVGELLQAIETKLTHQWIEKDLFVPYTDRARLALIHEHTEILTQSTTDDGFHFRIRSHPITFAQFFGKAPLHDAGQ